MRPGHSPARPRFARERIAPLVAMLAALSLLLLVADPLPAAPRKGRKATAPPARTRPASPPPAEVAGASRSLERHLAGVPPEQVWEALEDLGLAGDAVLTSESLSQLLKRGAERDGEAVRDMEATRKGFARKSHGKPGDPGARRKILDDLDRRIDARKGDAEFMARAKKLLDLVDVVSLSARAAGRAAGGDRAGVIGEVMQELAKKGAALVGGTLLAPIPVLGPVAGAGLGEYAAGELLNPEIQRRVDAVRDAEARERMLGDGGHEEQIMGEAGTRILPVGMTFDPGTGNIRRMTPEEAAERRERRLAERARMESSTHPLDVSMRQYHAGEIPLAELERRVREYNEGPEGGREGEPGAGETRRGKRKGVAAADRTGDPADEVAAEDGAEDGEEEDGCADGPGDGGEDDGDRKDEEGGPEVVAEVAPVKVTGRLKFTEDMSAGKLKNLVTTLFEVEFWNVGALVPGYERAVFKVTSTSSFTGRTEGFREEGRFTGGPDGTFIFGDMKARLVGGATIRMPEGKAVPLDNPEAFKDWSKRY